MPRPPKCRRISFMPDIIYFKPAGIPVRELEEVALTLDEMEAIRLADLEGLYQEDAAARMNVSRQTFANILSAAHRKIAEALIHGRALRIEGGNIEVQNERCVCPYCRHTWNIPSGSDSPPQCPRCKEGNICRATEEEKPGSGRRRSCRERKSCCRKNRQEEIK
jgi:uncharacterized protein